MNKEPTIQPTRSLLTILSSPRGRSNSTAIALEILEGYGKEKAAKGGVRSTHTGDPRENSTISSPDTAAADRGGQEEESRFFLRELTIGPCLGCDECKSSPEAPCVQNDDMQKIYPVLKRADTLILASPVYSFNLSGQLKIFIDRMYALWNEGGPDLLEGKRIVLVLTYGDDDVFVSGGVNAIRSLQDLCRFYGMEMPAVLHCSAGDQGEAEKNRTLLDRAHRLGKALAKGGTIG